MALWRVALLFCLFMASYTYGQIDTSYCNYEPLPTDFNSISYLGFNKEFHLHGEFLANYSLNYATLTFDIAETSAFRIYVAPHDVDIDLWLYNATTGSVVAHSSLEIGTEEQIEMALTPGSYSLKFNYFGVIFGTFSPTECDTMVIEVAVSPLSRLTSRLAQFTCPQENSLPALDFSGLTDVYSFSSNDTYVVGLPPPSNRTSVFSVNWIAGYNFTLTEIKGKMPLWTVEASLGVEFLSGASLGLLVLAAEDQPYLNCYYSGNCTTGAFVEMNQHTLKTTLSAGTYTLWIYDHYYVRDLPNVPCIPFSFNLNISVVEIPENFVTCDALALPTSLSPGFFENPQGVLHVADNFLVDLEAGGYDLSFYLRANTFFRALTSPHRIDIDLRLKNYDTGEILAWSLGYGSSEEAIVYYLTPGNYNLSIAFYGEYDYQFCETFYLEVAYGPDYIYNSDVVCNVQADVTPDLSGITEQIAVSNGSYVLAHNGPYAHVLPTDDNGAIDFTTHPFYVQTFTVAYDSFITIRLGFNYLLGELDVAVNDTMGGWYYADHQRDEAYIATTIYPGTYSIVLSTGTVQPYLDQDNIGHFPSCVEYNLQVSIKTMAVASPCDGYSRIPTNLNVPQYLGRSSIAHFVGDYLVPLAPGQFSTKETIAFTVTQASFVRAYTEPHHIDIDFRLRENGVLVRSTWKWGDEEEVTYPATPGNNYTLELVYYHWSHTDPHQVDPDCFVFRFEFGITPAESSTDYVQCDPYLPTNSTIPIIDGITPFYLNEQYFYTQGDTVLAVNIPFTVQQSVYFRAQIRYDFIWTDLSIDVTGSSTSSSYFPGVSTYNTQGFSTIVLPPGDYSLNIYEILPVDLAYRGCVYFWLELGFQPQSGPAGVSDYQGCKATYPPNFFNLVPYLSTVTGSRYHNYRNLLADIDSSRDSMYFSVAENSLISAFIPRHPNLDIDIYLRNATTGATLERSNGVTDEFITHNLIPGDYKIDFRFYGLYGSDVPTAADCPSFPMELEIVPFSYLTSTVPAITQSCTTVAPPTTITVDASSVYQQTFFRDMTSATPFSATMELTLGTKAVFTFDLRYEFAAGGLAMALTGQIQENLASPVSKTFYANYANNRAYFDRVLMPGTYQLLIVDPYAPRASSPIVCASYSISYLVNSSAVPSDACDDTDTLPTDLYTTEGGSQPFGGPQNAIDGSVRISGSNFFLDVETSRHNLILFKVLRPSYFRVFLYTERNDDIDFFIYSNTSRTFASMVYASIGTESVESAVVELQPQDEPYLLDVYFFRLASDSPACPTFQFELALETMDSVASEVACPYNLPVPEVPDPVVYLNNVYWTFNDYYFTSDRIAGNLDYYGNFEYPITIHTNTNATIVASIGYDFIVNDFMLVLSDSNHNVITGGWYSPSDNTDDYINFENFFWTYVEPGTYTLSIVERFNSRINFGLDRYCHLFEFFLAAFPDELNTNATIASILPAGGYELNPSQDLTLTITFSEAVNLQGNIPIYYINNRNAIYLVDMSDMAHLPPTTAVFDSSMTVLGVTFPHQSFEVGKTYQFVIDTHQFQTATGASFALADTTSLYYSMTSCSCSGHGTCNTGSICSCDTGYTGTDCSACAAGYHYAGTTCVADLKCQQSTCNGNGVCDDSGGYPLCTCNPGYASTLNEFCNVCAYGFTGYPNCTGNNNERPDTCKAPLIPTELDTIGFLGYNGQVHLQGEYYLDYYNFAHSVTFSLHQDSVFRLYTEPHKVDIDIWLYRVTDGGKLVFVDSGISFNLEENIYRVLPGATGSHPVQYLLRFRYFTWGVKSLSDCETFNLELSIAPVSSVATMTTALNTNCPGVNTLPMPTELSSTAFNTLPSTTYSYAPTNTFAIRARTDAPSGPNFFHNINFGIAAPAGQVAYLEVEVGYKFIVGDLGLVLEAGTSVSHCGDTVKGSSCIVGSNYFNRNRISRLLPDGNYTIWIYEPEPQNTTFTQCSPFTFSINVVYQDLTEDIYYCDASLLPSSLSRPGYMTSGSVHFADNYLVIGNPSIAFTVEQNSYLRIHGRGVSILAFNLYQGSSLVTSSSYGVHTHLFTTLAPGDYSVMVESFFIGTLCPTALIEFAIVPTGPYPNNCSAAESYPVMEDIRIPYTFDGSVQTFSGLLNLATLRQYSFVVDELAFVEVILDNDFLSSGLQLSLSGTQTDGTNSFSVNIGGVDILNRNYLRETLEPGSYTLKISKNRYPASRPSDLPNCAEFNFYFNLQSAASVDACSQDGEALPTSFNTMRYLGNTGSFDYQASSFRFPSFTGFTRRSITFTVNQTSLFRAYAEPHTIDIDLVLYQAGVISPVVDGGYGIGVEESITYVLSPGVQYTLQLLFWKWGVYSGPACPTFNMEVAIVPAIPASQCVDGAEIWPTQPQNAINNFPFFYSSVKNKETLYYQQKLNTTGMYRLDFTVSTGIKIYALLKYNFAMGDLVMTLTSGDNTYYGSNTANGDSLKLTGLPSGSYSLNFYEAVLSDPTQLRCVNFDFEIYIDQDNLNYNTEYDRLPASLNVIPFLNYENAVHLQNHFLMFSTSLTETVHFTVDEYSFLRVTAAHSTNQLNAIDIVLLAANGNIVAENMETLVLPISAGGYTLQFTQPASIIAAVPVNLEIAIRPTALIIEEVTPFSSPCTDSKLSTIVPNPLGQYQYSSDANYISAETMTTQSIVASSSVNLKLPSAFYARIGSNFLLGDFELQMTGTSTLGDVINVVGENGRNLNEINELLPPGYYTFSVTSRAVFPPSLMSSFPHCTVYSLRIYIQDENSQDHTDCSDYNLLPWDLNENNGGSAPFGGPVDASGSIHMAGKFLMPSTGSDSSSIRFTIVSNTLFSIVTHEGYFGQISYRITQGEGGFAELPKISSSYYDQKGVLFLLDEVGTSGLDKTVYNVEILFGLLSGQNACPYFDLQIAAKPLDQVAKQSICAPNFAPHLPTNTIKLLTGQVYSETIQSALTDNLLFASSNGYRYEIAITVTDNSVITASLSFNSLSNMFQTELYLNNTRRTRLAYGAFQMQKLNYGQTNLNLLLTGTLRPGNYILAILEPATSRLPLANTTTCYPFMWNLQIVPTSGVTYVTTVQPPVADYLNPSQTIQLDIAFSGDVYHNGVVVNSENLDPILSAFVLIRSGSTNTPGAASYSNGHFTLVFSEFIANTVYTLGITPGVLTDSQGQPVVLLSNNKYRTIDTTCSGKGTYDSGYCFCTPGYAGVTCDTCDVGYVDTNPSGSPICVQKTGKYCLKDSCGCDPKVTSDCSPKGSCDDSTGSIVCSCYLPWGGPLCSGCADGYENTTTGCQQIPKCPICVRGYCDDALGRCICPDHWGGLNCDECAAGWGGDSCTVAIATNPTNYNDAKWMSTLTGLQVFAIVITCLLIVGTFGFLLYKRFAQKKPTSYAAVFETLEEDSEVKQTPLEDNDD